MILVDRQLKELLSRENDILQNYQEENIRNISYDLRIQSYYTQSGGVANCQLVPGASVYVESQEVIHLPDNMIGQVLLRNSRIRQGLQIEAPIYQPGHKTRVYFRVTNLSNSVISLSTEDEIASIMFIQLDQAPETPYNGAFQNELNFRSLGNYEPELAKEMTELEKKVEDVHHIEKDMYGNVINLMIIFIGIFSLININVNLATNDGSNLATLLIFNLSTVGSVAFMTGILRLAFGDKKRISLLVWIACAVSYVLAIAVFLYIR